jgi:hypothetical protein
MLAFSRFWISSATAFGGLLRCAEHCFIVSSPIRRAAQSAGAVGNAALMVVSAA